LELETNQRLTIRPPEDGYSREHPKVLAWLENDPRWESDDQTDRSRQLDDVPQWRPVR
jgi:hypothetical protein